MNYHLAQSIGGITLWQNFSARQIERKSFGKLRRHSTTFSALVIFGWEDFDKFTDNKFVNS